jgi:menaquinone-dependent protoporphyrinogen oxidase
VKVLVTAVSKHGATKAIAEAIAARLRKHNLQTVSRSPLDPHVLDAVDAVVLGIAIYGSHMMPQAGVFAREWGEQLRSAPFYMFASGPLNGADVNKTPLPEDVRHLVDRLDPRAVALFPGSMRMEVLRPTERAVMRMVGALPGDYRDFEAINAWADGVARDLAGFTSD